jgi:hypothetical protein
MKYVSIIFISAWVRCQIKTSDTIRVGVEQFNSIQFNSSLLCSYNIQSILHEMKYNKRWCKYIKEKDEKLTYDLSGEDVHR